MSNIKRAMLTMLNKVLKFVKNKKHFFFCKLILTWWALYVQQSNGSTGFKNGSSPCKKFFFSFFEVGIPQICLPIKLVTVILTSHPNTFTWYLTSFNNCTESFSLNNQDNSLKHQLAKVFNCAEWLRAWSSWA